MLIFQLIITQPKHTYSHNKKEKHHMLASIIYLIKDVNAKNTLSLDNKALLSKIKIKKEEFMAAMPYYRYDTLEYRPFMNTDIKDALANRNIELTKSQFNNIGKIEISKNLLMSYQSKFIDKLNQWAELLSANKSNLIFHKDFVHEYDKTTKSPYTSWVPFEAKQLIHPNIGGLYFIIFDPDSNSSEIMTVADFMAMNATYIEINKINKLDYFVVMTPPNKIQFIEETK